MTCYIRDSKDDSLKYIKTKITQHYILLLIFEKIFKNKNFYFSFNNLFIYFKNKNLSLQSREDFSHLLDNTMI